MRTKLRNTIVTRIGVVLLLSAFTLVGITSADESCKKTKPNAGESRKPAVEEGAWQKKIPKIPKIPASKPKCAKCKQLQTTQHLAAAIMHLKAAGLDEMAEKVSQLQDKRNWQVDSRLSEHLEGIEDRIERRFEELAVTFEARIARKLEKLEAENSERGENAENGADTESQKKPG